MNKFKQTDEIKLKKNFMNETMPKWWKEKKKKQREEDIKKWKSKIKL